MRERLRRAYQRLGSHLGKAGILLLGFVIGGLVFSARSCFATQPHSDHSVMVPVSSEETRTASDPTRIILSDRAKALASLRTALVRRRPEAAAQMRMLGRIEADETTLRTITAWIGGRIDRLHVNVTGERVRAGQVIATLYSPEVFAAHQDLLVAKRQVQRMSQSPASSQQAAGFALEAARERLTLLGVPDSEVARMETHERPTRSVAIRTPFAGTVIERMASEGVYVTTGTPLYRLADLSALWVQLDAYESDLALVSVGQKVQISVDALRGEEFEGEVTFIEPTLDPKRRTAQVRVEVQNHDRRLRPGMFAEATVQAKAPSDERSPLVVPATAPLFTGRRAIVYVEVRDANRTEYEARTVRLGPRLGSYYPVVAGLSEGERVVVRGAFAVDADLQIRGGASMMNSPDDREAGVWDSVIELPAAARAKLAPVVSAYLAMQVALAADELARARQAAESLTTAIRSVRLQDPPQAAAEWPGVASALQEHARHAAMAENLEGMRSAFEPLSKEVETLLHRFGNPLDEPLQVGFCSMAAGSEGAYWIQSGDEIKNPYFGESMRSCGEVAQEVPPDSYLRSSETSEALRPGPAAGGGHQH